MLCSNFLCDHIVIINVRFYAIRPVKTDNVLRDNAGTDTRRIT